MVVIFNIITVLIYCISSNFTRLSRQFFKIFPLFFLQEAENLLFFISIFCFEYISVYLP